MFLKQIAFQSPDLDRLRLHWLWQNTDENLFVSGKAGTGKSYTLRQMVAQDSPHTVVLAPSGLAATNIGGQTIHSFFNFGININPQTAYLRGISTQVDSQLYRLMDQVDTLVIDEISMVRADLLDSMDAFLRGLYRSDQPFGGKRMVFFGDLYQLPPVVPGAVLTRFQRSYGSPFFFSAKVMEKMSFDHIELRRIYRQAAGEYTKILNAIRENRMTTEQLARLNTRVRPPGFDDQGYVYLTSRRRQADSINQNRLRALSFQTGIPPVKLAGKLRGGTVSPKQLPTDIVLKLMPGAQIIFVSNDTQGRWVNGTIGKVDRIASDGLWVETNDGEQIFVEKQTWPIYRYFLGPHHRMTHEVVAEFTQFPVKLAWAITIHKSQGQTYERAVVDLGDGAFEKGQTYVALSRVKSMDGLILQRPVRQSDVQINDYVSGFLHELEQSRTDLFSLRNKLKVDQLQEIIQRSRRRFCDVRYLTSSGRIVCLDFTPETIEIKSPAGYHPFIGVTGYAAELDPPDNPGGNVLLDLDRILEIHG